MQNDQTTPQPIQSAAPTPPIPPAETVPQTPSVTSMPPVEPVATVPVTPVSPQPVPVSFPVAPPQAMEEVKVAGLPPLEWNERTKNITVWSIVASLALGYLSSIGGYLSVRFFTTAILKAVDSTGTAAKAAKAVPISFDFINPLFSSIISGIVTAAILYFLYQRIFDWVQSHSWGKYLNTFFKMIFYPYLGVAVILTILGSLLNLMGAFVILIFSVAGHFVYAVILDRKIGHYFTVPSAQPSVPASPSAG